MAWRALLVALLCGALYVLLYHQWSVSVPSLVFALLAVVLLVVACIDLAHTIIPDTITLPGILAGLLASLGLTPVGLGNALIGALLGGSVFFIITVFSRGGMGGGDINLIAMIGAFLGWQYAAMHTTGPRATWPESRASPSACCHASVCP
jgi:leader peptidase (prepilin peptidase)/N-methyltransferase